MGKAKGFSDCRQSRDEKWPAKLRRPLKSLWSIIHLATSQTPAIIDRYPRSSQPQPDFIGPFSKHLDLLEK
jgi:hypothetical protein